MARFIIRYDDIKTHFVHRVKWEKKPKTVLLKSIIQHVPLSLIVFFVCLCVLMLGVLGDLFWFVFVFIFITWVSISVYFTRTRFVYYIYFVYYIFFLSCFLTLTSIVHDTPNKRWNLSRSVDVSNFCFSSFCLIVFISFSVSFRFSWFFFSINVYKIRDSCCLAFQSKTIHSAENKQMIRFSKLAWYLQNERRSNGKKVVCMSYEILALSKSSKQKGRWMYEKNSLLRMTRRMFYMFGCCELLSLYRLPNRWMVPLLTAIRFECIQHPFLTFIHSLAC